MPVTSTGHDIIIFGEYNLEKWRFHIIKMHCIYNCHLNNTADTQHLMVQYTRLRPLVVQRMGCVTKGGAQLECHHRKHSSDTWQMVQW